MLDKTLPKFAFISHVAQLFFTIKCNNISILQSLYKFLYTFCTQWRRNEFESWRHMSGAKLPKNFFAYTPPTF